MRLSFVAERYAYLAGIGVIAVLIGAAAHGASRLPILLKAGVSGVLVAVLAVFGKLTWEQSGVYRDAISFYNHILSFNPAASIHGNLAKELIDAGHREEALAASRIAVEQDPDSAASHNALGIALLGLNRLDEAAEGFQRARWHLTPITGTCAITWPRPAGARGASWNRSGGTAKCSTLIRSSRRRTPGWAMRCLVWVGTRKRRNHWRGLFPCGRIQLPIKELDLLADALRRQQRYEEAIETYRRILKAVPEYAPAHAGMGRALYQLKRYEEAVESLARSVSLEPESPEVPDRHVAMGRASEALGRTEAAAEHYGRALEIDARNAEALDSFAVLRFRQQRYEEALRFYETLIEMGEANAQVHANMGATLAYLDRPEEALQSLDSALSLDPTLARTGLGEMRDALRQERQ